MDDTEVQERELMDEVGSLMFTPPPMKKSDTRDSISSVDSDVSLSFDRRGSKGEEADADLSDSGSSELETSEDARIISINRITSQANLQTRHKPKISNGVEKTSVEIDGENNGTLTDSPVTQSKETQESAKINETNDKDITRVINKTGSKKIIDEEDDDEVPECSDELAEKISDQVEFYFSDENIVKDAFLLKHVKRNKEGYVNFLFFCFDISKLSNLGDVNFD